MGFGGGLLVVLLLMIFSSFFVLLLPGAASPPPPPAPSSSRDSSSPPALLPSFFTPSSPLLSPSFTVILRGRRGRKEGGTQSGRGAPRGGRETPGLRGEKFSCRNSSQHGRRCLLLNPLSFAVPTQQPVPRAGGGKPRHNPPQTGPNGSRGPPVAPRLRPEGLRAAFGREIARPNSGVWQLSPAPEERQPLGRRSRTEQGSAAPPSHPTPPRLPGPGLSSLLTAEPRPGPPRGGDPCSWMRRRRLLLLCVCVWGWDWPRLPRFPLPSAPTPHLPALLPAGQPRPRRPRRRHHRGPGLGCHRERAGTGSPSRHPWLPPPLGEN